MSTFGVVLVLLSAALAVAEAHVPSGALGAGAIAALAGGIALLAPGAGLDLVTALAIALAATCVMAAYLWMVVPKALVARRRRVRSGAETLVGRVGEVRAVPAPVGQVFLDGSLWRARLWRGEEAVLQRGDPIVVEQVDGLTLTVRPAEEWEVAP